MAFGENFQAVYTPPQLDDGEYTAKIEKAEIDTWPSGDDFCRVTVSIKGHPGELPNTITLNSAPRLGQTKANGQPVTQKDIDRVNRALTRFFECFGIQPGNFNLPTWKGHVGTVKIAPRYDRNESDHKSKSYKDIFPQTPKKQGASAPAVQPQSPRQQLAQAGKDFDQLPPAPDPTPADGGFPEDIPY